MELKQFDIFERFKIICVRIIVSGLVYVFQSEAPRPKGWGFPEKENISDLLMVDEPTEGLAPVTVKEVRDILEEINKAGVSILLVEHNLKVAMSLANRVYLMGKAHLGFAGTIEELEAQPEIRAKYLEV